MNRDETLALIRRQLDATGLRYEIVYSGPKDIRVRFDTDQNRFSALGELEEALAEQGILFDTAYDLAGRKREWLLDQSLEVEGKVLSRPPKSGGKGKLNYRAGDIVRIPLDDLGNHGYGRILLTKPPLILVEFFPAVARTDPRMDTFEHADWILKIYTTDVGITEEKTWKVIGHLPVGKISKPLLWLKDPLTQKLLLFRHPLDQKWHRETTLDEIRRLRAQPGMVFGHEAARVRLADELRKAGLLL